MVVAVKYAFLAVGLVLLSVAVISAKNTRTFVAQASAAHGTVIELIRRQSAIRTPTRLSCVSSPRRAKPSSSHPRRAATTRVREGERMDVLYRPLAPRDARINDFASLWAGSIIFAALGSIFVTIGGGMIVSAFSSRAKQPTSSATASGFLPPFNGSNTTRI